MPNNHSNLQNSSNFTCYLKLGMLELNIVYELIFGNASLG